MPPHGRESCRVARPHEPVQRAGRRGADELWRRRHGAHLAFGAQTGGSVDLLGGVLVTLTMFSSGTVHALFQPFPTALLSIVLCLTGVQFATGGSVLPAARRDQIVVLVCAALCI